MKATFLIIALFIASSMFLQSCGTGDISKAFTKIQAVRLLASDQKKTWVRVSKTVDGQRVELSECEQNNTLAFEVTDSDSLLYKLGQPPGCTSNQTEADTLLKASWSLSQNINLISTDTLFLSDLEGRALPPFIIQQLSARRLNLLFMDQDKLTTEEYTF